MNSRWRCDRCHRWKIRAMMSIDYLCFVCDKEQLRIGPEGSMMSFAHSIYKPENNNSSNIQPLWKKKTPGNWSESLNQEITSELSSNLHPRTQDGARPSRKRKEHPTTSISNGLHVVQKARKDSSNS